MADITMCTSENCPNRFNCYRVNAKEDDLYQSWSNFEYVCNEVNGFGYYMRMIKNTQKGSEVFEPKNN